MIFDLCFWLEVLGYRGYFVGSGLGYGRGYFYSFCLGFWVLGSGFGVSLFVRGGVDMCFIWGVGCVSVRGRDDVR